MRQKKRRKSGKEQKVKLLSMLNLTIKYNNYVILKW